MANKYFTYQHLICEHVAKRVLKGTLNRLEVREGLASHLEKRPPRFDPASPI